MLLRLWPVLTVLVLVGCADRRVPVASVPQPAVTRVKGAGPGVIPAGTTLDVRTNESIHSSKANEGQSFTAEIATEVVGAGGEVLLPRGAKAELVMLEIRPKHGIKGPGVQLGLQSVEINGQKFLVTSKESEQSAGLGRNRRTAEMVGGGAALGTILGTTAGGGKGAVFGGLLGAAAGAAVQVLTQGDEIRIPAETVLTFRLEEPLRLQPAASIPPAPTK